MVSKIIRILNFWEWNWFPLPPFSLQVNKSSILLHVIQNIYYYFRIFFFQFNYNFHKIKTLLILFIILILINSLFIKYITKFYIFIILLTFIFEFFM